MQYYGLKDVKRKVEYKKLYDMIILSRNTELLRRSNAFHDAVDCNVVVVVARCTCDA